MARPASLQAVDGTTLRQPGYLYIVSPDPERTHAVPFATMLLSAAVLSGCGRLAFEPFGSADAGPDYGVDGAISAYSEQVLADGPIAYWRLGDSGAAGVRDVTGNGHDGVIVGGATPQAEGLIAGDPDAATRFDGATGYVTIADHPSLRLPGPITLEAWIVAESFTNPGGEPFQRIVNKGFDQSSSGYVLAVTRNETADSAMLRFETEGLNRLHFTGTSVLLPHMIYHVVATYDGSELRLYVNGALDASTDATGNLIAHSHPVVIGRRPDGARYWHGRIDEVAIYDQALSAARIAAHHAAGH